MTRATNVNAASARTLLDSAGEIIAFSRRLCLDEPPSVKSGLIESYEFAVSPFNGNLPPYHFSEISPSPLLRQSLVLRALRKTLENQSINCWCDIEIIK